MTVLKAPLLIGAMLVTVAGCAGQPRQAGPNAPVAVAAGTSDASAPGTQKALYVPGLTTRMLARARDDGYKPRMVGRQFRFCRVEIPVGSNLPVRQCVNTAQLKNELIQEQETRQNLEESAGTSCISKREC